jgi:hypothetical protein
MLSAAPERPRRHRIPHGRSLFIVLLVVTLFVAASCSATGEEAAEPATTTIGASGAGDPVGAGDAARGTQQLFTVQGEAGTAAPSDQDWTVIVDVESGRMLQFTDRPQRDAAHIEVADFVDDWSAYGFDADPPNGTITGTTPDGTEVDVAAELTAPSWDEPTSTLTVTATPIGADSGATLPNSFDQLSLFIDDAAVYRSIRTIIRNSSNETFTVEGFAVESGVWGHPRPTEGTELPPSSTTEFAAQSTTINLGVSMVLWLNDDSGTT